MDFFEAQAHAKRRTARLVILFVLAVIGTVVACYAAAVLIGAFTGGKHAAGPRLLDPVLFFQVAAGVLLVIGLASAFKWLQFSSGGKAVAQMVGGREISAKTTDLSERRLLNIVEEMAIASGVPMPAVYILDEEEGVNAFAAGLTTGDAVVAVTRGTLQKLNREELQGVVGHEFSHILNGDMRLNVRLSAILFGILALGLLGRGILEVMGRGRVRGDRNKNSGVVVIALAGLALFVIGYIGYLFGRMIQSAVSRQREFLADASAVQFTRNPNGIAGALKKIGSYSQGSRLQSAKAAQIGHFFFAQGFDSWFGGLFATHPPLEERIRAIDPAWKGRFDAPVGNEIRLEAEQPSSGFAPSVPATQPETTMAFRPTEAASRAGVVTDAHFLSAQKLLQSIPVALHEAAQTKDSAQALLLAVLCAGDLTDRVKILAIVRANLGQDLATAAEKLTEQVRSTPPEIRLPLVQLALAPLRQLDEREAGAFLKALEEAARADATVSPLEVALIQIVRSVLRNTRKPSTSVQFYSFQEVAPDITVVLSCLARVGSDSDVKAASALSSGVTQLKLIEASITLLPPQACSLASFTAALERLGQASLPIKKRLLVAAAHLIGADGEVTVAEAELYRAVAAALDCPMPVWEQNA